MKGTHWKLLETQAVFCVFRMFTFNLDPTFIKIGVSFTIGLFSGGIVVHLLHIKINHQSSKGDKSPNTAGKNNKVDIR